MKNIFEDFTQFISERTDRMNVDKEFIRAQEESSSTYHKLWDLLEGQKEARKFLCEYESQIGSLMAALNDNAYFQGFFDSIRLMSKANIL